MNRNIVWTDLADRLMAALRPIAAPIGIAFVPHGAASDAPPFDGSYPAPNVSGRTGAVSAGCDAGRGHVGGREDFRNCKSAASPQGRVLSVG